MIWALVAIYMLFSVAIVWSFVMFLEADYK